MTSVKRTAAQWGETSRARRFSATTALSMRLSHRVPRPAAPAGQRTLLTLLGVALSVCLAPGARAENWPHWRGPAYDGSSPETGLPATWSKSDGLVWSAPMPGPSGATPVVWANRICISSTEAESDALLALCVSARDGKVLWRKRLGTDAKAPSNNMASPSPVTDGNVVCFLYGTGEVAGLDMAGNVLWQRDLGAEFGRVAIKYGYSSSPLLFGGRLYVLMLRRPWPYPYSPGKPTPADEAKTLDSFLLALDPKTGKTLWRHVRPTDTVNESFESYATPLPFAGAGRAQILINGGDYLTGHDPATGRQRWRWCNNPAHKDRQRLIPSVVFGGGLIFFALPRGSGMAAVKAGGSGLLSRRAVAWMYKGSTTDAATPLFYDGRLYVLNGDKKEVFALNPRTGRELWRGELGGRYVWRSSPTGADGKIYVMSEQGEVVVLAAGDAFRILARIPMGPSQRARSTIAVSGGRLFIRTDETLFCVGK